MQPASHEKQTCSKLIEESLVYPARPLTTRPILGTDDIALLPCAAFLPHPEITIMREIEAVAVAGHAHVGFVVGVHRRVGVVIVTTVHPQALCAST